jgi:MFS family permease
MAVCQSHRIVRVIKQYVPCVGVARHELSDLFRRQGFRRLLATRWVGQFGDGLLQAALATFVLFSPEREPDPAKVAVAFTILLLPYSIIGPFAGVLLDRWHRSKVLVRANGIKALMTLPVIALVLSGNDGPLLGISVLFVLGVGRFVLAGLSASMPHVVEGRELVTANALAPTTGTLLAAAGALFGVVVRDEIGGDLGSAAVLTLAIASYLTAGGIARRFRATELGPHGEHPRGTVLGVLTGLVDGVCVLRSHGIAARAIGLVGAHRIVLGALTVGALLLVRNTFNAPTDADDALRQFAIVTGAAALGAGFGAVMTPFMSRKLGATRWSLLNLLSSALVALPLVMLGAMLPAFPLILVGAFVFSTNGQSLKVTADTLTQRHVPDDHLGRVFTLYDMTVNVSMVIGVCLMAFTAPITGQAPLQFGLAMIWILVVCLWYATRTRGAFRLRS